MANAHTLFNVGIALCFLPFTGLFARLIEWILPEKPEAKAEAEIEPRYLDESLLETPSLALGVVHREVSRMGDVLEKMLSSVPEAVFKGNKQQIAKIRKMDDQVDILHAKITEYLAKIGQESISEATANDALAAISVASELENIGDIMENNLAHLGEVCAKRGVKFGPGALQLLIDYHQRAQEALRSVIVAFVSDNVQVARIVMGMKGEVKLAEERARQRQALLLEQKFQAEEINDYVVLMDILENLKRIYYHTKRVAKQVTRNERNKNIPVEVERREY